MEPQSTTQKSLRPAMVEGISQMAGKTFCQCGEGWTCIITRTKGSDASKALFKCGENCTCVIDSSAAERNPIVQQNPETIDGGGAYCKCEEGWSCLISKIAGPDASKSFFECAGNCMCAADA